MAKKQMKELVKLSDNDLNEELKSCQESLMSLRFKKVVEEVADITKIRKTKRKIARIKTIQRQREQEAAAKKD